MSLLDAFRRRSQPATWREENVLLIADLDRFELNGVGFGQPVEDLRFLGPGASGAFDYPAKGLQLDVDSHGRLDGLGLALRSGAYLDQVNPEGVREFAGRIRLRGRDWVAHELKGENDFVVAWGEPYWRDTDEDETLVFFEFARHEVQVELTRSGVPQVLFITAHPLMADPAQRESYGVTAPWPPRDLAGAP
ncbi:MAG: hypothetical protein OEO79_08540 [Gemmatimonadota bacterium]|nr:hypothetical protein [Gemmatimonadota bacterium]